jgi:Fucose permease
LIGVGNSNIFSIIFSKALLYMPSRNNEISGLMIMGIFGGAIFPVFMGFMSDIFWRADWGCSCFDSLCHLSTIPND